MDVVAAVVAVVFVAIWWSCSMSRVADGGTRYTLVHDMHVEETSFVSSNHAQNRTAWRLLLVVVVKMGQQRFKAPPGQGLARDMRLSRTHVTRLVPSRSCSVKQELGLLMLLLLLLLPRVY